MASTTNRNPAHRPAETSSLLGLLEFKPRLVVVLVFLTLTVAVVGWRISRDAGGRRVDAMAREAVGLFASALLAATIVPAAIARSARATAVFHASERSCTVPDPGSSRGTSTRNTWPRVAGRGIRPVERATISAVVLLAADLASASSRSLDERDQVVKLTLPSSRPDAGSNTGTAAQVNEQRLSA